MQKNTDATIVDVSKIRPCSTEMKCCSAKQSSSSSSENRTMCGWLLPFSMASAGGVPRYSDKKEEINDIVYHLYEARKVNLSIASYFNSSS